MTEANDSKFVEIATAGQGAVRYKQRIYLFGRRADGTLAYCEDEEEYAPVWVDIQSPRSDDVPIRQISITTMAEWTSVQLYVLYEDGALARIDLRTGHASEWRFIVKPPAYANS